MNNKITRYRVYNRQRKIRAIAFNENKAILLFKIIPFLLHCNFPDLPGYVDDPDCPFGIHRLQPEKLVSAELFRKHFPTSQAWNRNTPSPFATDPCIQSLKTIGSIGTIAQTEKSDCDFWISLYQREIGEDGLELLKEKCRGIEEWCANKGVEVYFFLMDIEQTRENSFESRAEEESAGSSIKILLKDELFRSHILVAGKMLLWWLIPPGLSDKGYRRFVQRMIDSKSINMDNFVDLGYLSNIPKSEIFGACLWQMNKALDSPFKSVIKFAYLELLLRETKQALPLFSDTVKCLVTYPEARNTTTSVSQNLTDVDPYLLMAREIVAFYQLEKTEQKRADIIRQCLFLKTLEGVVSRKKSGTAATVLDKTIDQMKAWQLLPDNYSHFLQLKTWEYKELLALGTKIHDYIIETYKRLRTIFLTFEGEMELTITQRDIAVLGRKLFTFYEKKPHKIEYIRSISREAMAQKELTIHIARAEDANYFYAFQGKHDHLSVNQRTDLIIRRETNPVSLIAWLLVNGIINETTVLHLTKNFLAIELVDIQNLVEKFLTTFPLVHFAKISAEHLVQEETIVRALIVVNMTKEPVKDGKSLHSTLLTVNSYGEYFVEEFDTAIQIKNTTRMLLTKHFVSRWNNNLEIFIPPQKDLHLIRNLIHQ